MLVVLRMNELVMEFMRLHDADVAREQFEMQVVVCHGFHCFTFCHLRNYGFMGETLTLILN